MNAALLFLSSACMGDPVVVGAPGVAYPAPPVMMAGPVMGGYGGYGGCGSCGDACGAGFSPGCQDPNPRAEREGLFSRLKARLGGSSSRGMGCDSGCATSYAPPMHYSYVPTTSYMPAPSCDMDKPGLFARLKARLCGKHKHDCAPSCAATTLSTCGGCMSGYGDYSHYGYGTDSCALPLAPGMVAPLAPSEAPKEMEKPDVENKKPTPIGSLGPTGVVPVASSKSPF